LAFLVIVFTALGVSNTLVINVMTRRDEFILLRSAGMTRRQVALMVLLEGGFMGLVGGALGLGFGWLLARLMPAVVLAVSGLRLDFSMPVEWTVICFVTVLFASLAASLAPARRAARLSSPG
jgi:putative ABC transport system permease protein